MPPGTGLWWFRGDPAAGLSIKHSECKGYIVEIRFVIQFMAGLLLVAGAVGMLASAIDLKGFNGAAIYNALIAAVLIGIGILVALDSVSAIHVADQEGEHADRY